MVHASYKQLQGALYGLSQCQLKPVPTVSQESGSKMMVHVNQTLLPIAQHGKPQHQQLKHVLYVLFFIG